MPYDAAALVLDGKMEIVIGEKMLIIQEGDFVVMPPNIPHSIKAIERFKMLLIMMRSNL